MRIQTAEFVRSATAPEHFLRDGMPAVAFVGRSNVGKSTVLNRLLARRKLARTSSTPGRTQAVNYFLVNRRFYFVDLPGYGYAKAAKEARKRWAKVVDRYLHLSRPRPLVIVLVDGKVGGTPLDRQAYEYFESLDLPILVVATKMDKVPAGRRARAAATVRSTLDLPEEQQLLSLSAVSGMGIKELWAALEAFLDSSKQTHP